MQSIIVNACWIKSLIYFIFLNTEPYILNRRSIFLSVITDFPNKKEIKHQTLINRKRLQLYTAPSRGHSPVMQVQYSSAKRSSSDFWVTLSGSGQGDWGSGVTFDSCLCIVLVGVQMAGVVFSGELVCWASLDLEKTRGHLVTNTVISFKLNLTASSNIPFSPKQLSFFLQTVRTASGQFGPSALWYGRGTGRQAERGGCEAALRIGVRALCTYGSWVDSPWRFSCSGKAGEKLCVYLSYYIYHEIAMNAHPRH